MCGGCIGECPYGVSRSDLLRVVMYHEGYENDSLVRESLGGITKHHLQACTECSSCSVVCRRGVDIREQVKLAQDILA